MWSLDAMDLEDHIYNWPEKKYKNSMCPFPPPLLNNTPHVYVNPQDKTPPWNIFHHIPDGGREGEGKHYVCVL